MQSTASLSKSLEQPISDLAYSTSRSEQPVASVTVLTRGSDTMTVLSGQINLAQSAQSLCGAAAAQVPQFPAYRPDGAGVIVVFHTETGNHVLGSVRSNSALASTLAPDGRPYPLQINTCLGGYLPDPEKPLKDAIMAAARSKILRGTAVSEFHEAYRSQQQLREMLELIEADAGWENQICIHTDKWKNEEGNDQTMCFLTAVKHIQCTDADRNALEQAFKVTASLPSSSPYPATVMSFSFASLERTAQNSLETYAADEVAKARHAWEAHGDTVAVVFNDLAMAALKKNRAFESDSPARLTLSSL